MCVRHCQERLASEEGLDEEERTRRRAERRRAKKRVRRGERIHYHSERKQIKKTKNKNRVTQF